MENLSNSNGYEDTTLHVHVTSPVNASRTCERIGAPLTQPCSADVQGTRSMLKRLAVKHGATSAIGHAAHNMLEMTEHIVKGAKGDQLSNIIAKLSLEQARLSRLLAA